jgi:hypothetical protein
MNYSEYEAEKTMAFKRIDEEFHTARKRRREKLRWYRDNPSPKPIEEQLLNLKRALWD